MKYIISTVNSKRNKEKELLVMFDSHQSHSEIYNFLINDVTKSVTLDCNPKTAGSYRFIEDGISCFGSSISLDKEAGEDDDEKIMSHLLDHGGEFILFQNGDLVVVSKGYHDFREIEERNDPCVRGSFRVVDNERQYLYLTPKIQYLYTPDKAPVNLSITMMDLVAEIINCN